MSKYFDCSNCGLCCGPIPITNTELEKINKSVKKMTFAKLQRLKAQNRSNLECMFRDLEQDKCSIYSARPDICRMFGFYEGMECPNNPKHATRGRVAGYKRIDKNKKNDPIVGVLSIDITWENIL